MRTRMPGAAAIYARVSTERQAIGDKTSLDRQEKNCRRTADKLGLTVRDAAVVKEVHSASDPDNRPALAALYGAAARREFAYVLMDVIDRTTRAGPGDFFDICTRFLTLGVEPVWAGHPDIDMTTTDGQVEAAKLAIRAYEDKQTIARRFQEGKQERVEAGKLIRATIAYGYRWNAEAPRYRGDYLDDQDPREMWELDPDTAPIVRRIFETLAHGYRTGGDASAVGLMHALNAEGVPTPSQVKRLRRRDPKWRGKPAVWQVPTLIYLVRNPSYMGERPQQRWLKNGHAAQIERPQTEWRTVPVPAIVDAQTWEDANKQLERNRSQAHRPPRRFTADDVLLFGGTMRCAFCMRGLIPYQRHRRWYYRCAKGCRPKARVRDDHPYGMPFVWTHEADAFVWEEAKRLIRDEAYLRSLLAQNETQDTWSPAVQVTHYRQLIAECDATEAGLAMEIGNLGGDPLLAGVRARLVEDVKRNATARVEYQAKLEKAERAQTDEQDREARVAAFVERARQQAGTLDDLTAEERRVILLDMSPVVWVGRRGAPKAYLQVIFNLRGKHEAHVRPDDWGHLFWHEGGDLYLAGADDPRPLDDEEDELPASSTRCPGRSPRTH